MFGFFPKKDKNIEETEINFKSYEDSVAPEAAPAQEPVEEPAPKKTVASMTANGDNDSNIELKVVRPSDFSEVSDIADHLIRGCTVVLNTEELDIKATMRMLDFLNGVTYTTGGEIKNVNNTTFIITPNYVDVSDN
ncbi:MAG: cell division protein SepF [Clostridia bacterium]|nr:cell division protein SepF [Clostridia bacterium]